MDDCLSLQLNHWFSTASCLMWCGSITKTKKNQDQNNQYPEPFMRAPSWRLELIVGHLGNMQRRFREMKVCLSV